MPDPTPSLPEALAALAANWQRQVTVWLEVTRPLFQALAVQMTVALEALAPILNILSAYAVERAAIERYGITEADIRRVEGNTVVLWNRRRIEVTL